MDIVEYKINEFIGDAVLKLLVCELVITSNDVSEFHKRKLIQKVMALTCNDYLSVVAQELGLVPHADDKDTKQSPLRPPKVYANAYEVMVYQIYSNQGIEACREFIKQTLVNPKTKKR